MAKNKGTYGRGKSSVEETDEFIEGVGEAVETLMPHKKLLIVLGVVATSGLLGFAAFHWHINKERAAASSLYAEALRLAYLPIEAKDEDEPEPIIARPESFESAQARDEAVVSVLDSLKDKYAESGVYAKGRALHASTLARLGKYDLASAIYQSVADASKGRERIAALEGLAFVDEERAETAEDAKAREANLNAALEKYGAIADASTNEPSGDETGRANGHYHAGRMLAALGKTKEAIARFEQALEVEPDTSLKPTIEERLDVLRRASN